MHADHDFRRAIELIKQRAPIEDVVRERVPDLKQKGNRLWACCPFHDEDTPSFTVNPREGFWYCFGACARGGDQITFLQQFDNLAFGEAIEILAARTGVELPRRSGKRGDDRERDAGLDALERAEALYREALRTREGRRAVEYMAQRGLSDNTIQAFGVGYAPANGRAIVGLIAEGQGEKKGPNQSAYERAGLVRTADDGHAYDFFRGRLMIPIRDVKGRVVGFGGRRLDDTDKRSPKYINTSETPYFHKGRLVYALDRAVDSVRRGGQLVLVEGYTDVMAAHQAGLAHVAAVLGTSTTEDHAGLVRRAGARKVSLVFDGDEAGRRAALRALHGLLPLDIDLEVVTLPSGSDPCDMIVGGGAQPFLATLEMAQDWFDFVADGLGAFTGKDLAREVDTVLELFGRVRKPVHRESLIRSLAERLAMPIDSLREQWRQLPEPRRPAASAGSAPAPAANEAAAQKPAAPGGATPSRKRPVERRVVEAYKKAIGAVLLDSSLVPRVRGLHEDCPNEYLKAILGAILSLWDDEDAEIDASSVVTELADHPVRDHVASLVEYARTADDDPASLLDSELRFLIEREHELQKQRLKRRVAELQAAADAGDPEAQNALGETIQRLSEIHQATHELGTARPA
ncbi:MAG: DNA primase [bacterium]|nr:DNA primase [bacterium]